MPTDRIQRKIDQLLEEAEQAIDLGDWGLVRARCEQALRLDPGNADARGYLAAAERGPDEVVGRGSSGVGEGSPLPEGEGQGVQTGYIGNSPDRVHG